MNRRSFLTILLLVGTGCRSFSLSSHQTLTEKDFSEILVFPEDSEVESLDVTIRRYPEGSSNHYSIHEPEQIAKAMAVLRELKCATWKPQSWQSSLAPETAWPIEIQWELKKDVPSGKYPLPYISWEGTTAKSTSPTMNGRVLLDDQKIPFTLPFATGRKIAENLEELVTHC